MKADAFMPFYFRSFWEAVEELPDWMIIAYLRSLTYNWGHRGCEGLRNDEDALRKLCRIHSDEHWSQAWNTIFAGTEYWTLGEDGLWHQKFQDEIWAEVQCNYNSRVNGGKTRAERLSAEERSAIARAGGLAKGKRLLAMQAPSKQAKFARNED